MVTLRLGLLLTDLYDVVCLSRDVSVDNQEKSVKNDSENVDSEVGEESDFSHNKHLDSISSQDKMVARPKFVVGRRLESSDWTRALMPHTGSNPSHHFLITLGPLLRSKCSRPGRRRLALRIPQWRSTLNTLETNGCHCKLSRAPYK